MSDEPTAGEVSRALGVLRDEVRDDRAQTRDALSRTVTKEVYLADRHNDRVRFEDQQRQISDMERALAASQAAVAKAKADRAANRRIVWISVIIPIGLAIAEIVVTVRGGR